LNRTLELTGIVLDQVTVREFPPPLGGHEMLDA
jgi:hypothetical protein